jgi:prepilin-type N-terminal cleavage/methylation domain-containing protein/prepilin-type processing-associated H-X9-DG protein
MTRNSRNPRGFTLIELLVVIAIIAVLIGLLLPAVQKVREASARAKCTNNMKQILIAAHAYHGVFDSFPGNSQAEGGWDWNYQKTQKSWSWLARLLPHLEQDNLYTAASVGTNTFLQSASYLTTGLPVFWCPSDTAIGLSPSTNRANLQGQPIATSNYKGVTGDCWAYGTYVNYSGHCAGKDGLTNGDGIFNRDDNILPRHPRRIAEITDGLSDTFFLGEDIPEFNAHCAWMYANGSLGTCAIPPNVMSPPPGYDIYGGWPWLYSFRSRHAGGLNFAYADGSVHFINDTIALPVYRALATCNQGEPVAVP